METLQDGDIEEKRNIIDCLHDTFVKYLQPGVIIDNNKYFGHHRDEIVKNQTSRETLMQNLLALVQEDDTAVQQFTETLRNLTCDSADIKIPSDSRHPSICVETDDEKLCVRYHMKNLVKAVDGSLFRGLSRDDTAHVLDELLEEKVITERTCKQGKNIVDPYNCCVKVLSSMKRGKPDGPLAFFAAIIKTRPDLTQPLSQQETQMTQTNSVAANNDESPSSSSFGAQHLSDFHIGDWQDSPSLALSSSSSAFSTTGSKKPKRKILLLEEEKRALPWSVLTESGNLDERRLTSDPNEGIPINNSEQDYQSTRGGFSDSEEGSDEEDSSQVEHEKPPPLELREYQKELAENALKGRNTIICAPTGSGKTRVATHIILNHLMGEEQDGEQKRKVAFMARTVPLVMQQCKSLKTYLPKEFHVTYLTGDSEDSRHLHMILKDNDVIVMTPRILENHLKWNCLENLGVFSMLVFDECHHTRKGEPYNTLMYSYLKTKKNDKDIKLPQIVGLTASISVEKAIRDEEAVKYILQICGNLDADNISCVAKNEEELLAKVPVPEELMVRLYERENDGAVEKIKDTMSKLEKSAGKFGEDIAKPELSALLKKIPSDKKSQQYGQWTVKIKNTAKAMPREELRETNISAYNVALELHDLVQLREVMAYLDRCFDKYKYNTKPTSYEKNYYDEFEALQKLVKNQLDVENPNLTTLKKTLRKHLVRQGEPSRGIIFVRTRALTDAITSWLSKCPDEELKELEATVFTGTAASVEQGGMTTVEQDEVIRKFKSGEVRLLVATSVGEEGLDIPECNLVIKYNHVGNEVTTVQTRGRSRKKGGKSILLAMEHILRKERINQEKAKMMIRAIKEIRQMKRSKIRKMNQAHQEEIMKGEEINEIIKRQEESRLKRKPFKMVCSMCRKVVIDSKDIKTIFGTHRVVVDRKILEQTKTKPYVHEKFFDDVRIIGSVRCLGEPEEGTDCYTKLGSMMVYARIPFVVLGIKYFGFDTGSELGLEFYNQWKKVPYAIDEIGAQDFQRYLPEKEQEEEKSDDSDEDSDEDSDRNSDEDKRPPHDHDKGKEEHKGPPGQIPDNDSITELKRPQTDGSDVAAMENASSFTAPKRLPNVSNDKNTAYDSGFLQNSELSFSTSQPNALALEGAVGGVRSSYAVPQTPLKSGDERLWREHYEKPHTQIDKELYSCLDKASVLSSKLSITKLSIVQSVKAPSLQISDDGSSFRDISACDETVARASEHEAGSDETVAKASEHETENDESVAKASEHETGSDESVAKASEHEIGKDETVAKASEHEIRSDETVAKAAERETESDETVPEAVLDTSGNSEPGQNSSPSQGMDGDNRNNPPHSMSQKFLSLL